MPRRRVPGVLGVEARDRERRKEPHDLDDVGHHHGDKLEVDRHATSPSAPGAGPVPPWITSLLQRREYIVQRLLGVDNPLFYKDNNHMLFGDAKKTLDDVLAALK